MSGNWDHVITLLRNDIRGFVAASVVDMDTGMTLASQTARSGFDLEMASAYNSEMVKLKLKTIEALGIDTTLEDMLLTLGDQLHLVKMLSPTAFLYLAADRKETNLAIIRGAVLRHVAAA